jgi:uncharacterized protein with von Willebrand factor type A (vWA) domain
MNPMDKQLAYDVTRWQRFLYEDEKFHNKNLQDTELAGIQNVSGDYGVFQKEVFARLYSNDDLPKVESPVDWAEKLHNQLDESREFASISSRCKGDELWSGIACSTLSKSLSATMQDSNAKAIENAKRDVEEAQNIVDGLEELKARGANVGRRLEKANAKLVRAKENLNRLDSKMNVPAIQRAIRKACDTINVELNETERLIDSMVYDSSEGSSVAGSSGNVKRKRELASKLQANPKLREVAKLAGRLRRIAAKKQRSKTENTCNEISDIQQGDSIDRLLPSELIGLVEPLYEIMFYRNLLEKQLLQYELKGKEIEGKGPIIICIDESVSMRGQRDVWSKAVALALLEIARKQKRAFSTVHFSSSVDKIHVVGVKDEVTPDTIDKIVNNFAGGGTSYEAPLGQVMKMVPKKKADVIFITDGACEVSNEFLDRWNAAKKELEFSLYSIAISCLNTATLNTLSDQVFNLDDMLQSEEMEDSLFSI